MPVIAVVGGTGSLGRTMAEVLQADPRHKVVVLARKSSDKVEAIPTDYANVEATAKTLQDSAVDTVVCAINVGDPSSSDAQLNIIRAAASSGTVKRFIVSEWGLVHEADSPYYPFRQASYEALRATSLEWTRVSNGFFMDYWGIARGLKSYMAPIPDLAVDIAHKKAAIPGTGEETVCMTYTFDVARYLAAFLADTESKWEETTYFFGDRITLNAFVKTAETATGSKFEVTYDPVEKLEKGEVTELPSHPAVYPFFPKPAMQGLLAMFGRWIALGRADIPAEKTLNKKYPEVEILKIPGVIALWQGTATRESL